MYEPTALATFIIIILTGAATLYGFKHPRFCNRFMFDSRPILQDKQFDRLLTSGLLHLDWMHLGFNMLALYGFGSAIELRYSANILVFTYILSILGGSLLSLWIYRNTAYRALGASGGVCGLIYAYIFLFPGSKLIILPIPFPLPAWLIAILFLLYTAFGMRSQGNNVGHLAHLGGAAVGLLTTLLLFPEKVLSQPGLLATFVGLAIGIAAFEHRRFNNKTIR